MWRTNDILDVIFGDEESEEESCGEETHQISKKHGTLGTSSGSVKEQVEKQGKENLDPENSEERGLDTRQSASRYRRKTNQNNANSKGKESKETRKENDQEGAATAEMVMTLSSQRRGRKQANPKSAEKGKENFDEEVDTQLQRPKQTMKGPKQTKKGEKNCGKKETTRKRPEAPERAPEPPSKHSRCSGNTSKELEGQKPINDIC